VVLDEIKNAKINSRQGFFGTKEFKTQEKEKRINKVG